MSEIIAAGFEKERRQDAARARVRIAHAASKFSEANREAMRSASAPSAARRAKAAPTSTGSRPTSTGSPRSTAARPSPDLIRSVARSLGYIGRVGAAAERQLLRAQPGETIKLGAHSVTVNSANLNVRRAGPSIETRYAALSVR